MKRAILITVVLGCLAALCFVVSPATRASGPVKSAGGPGESASGRVKSAGGPGKSAGGPGKSAGGPGKKEVTFNKDLAQILYSNCAECHRPNDIAPMSLLTYK